MHAFQCNLPGTSTGRGDPMPRTAFIGVAWSELERTLARERRRTASDQPAATPGTGKILLRHSGRLALLRTLEALDPDDRRLLLQNVLAVEGRHLRIVGGVLRVTAVRPRRRRPRSRRRGRIDSAVVNPFVVLPEGRGAVVLDAVIVTRRTGASTDPGTPFGRRAVPLRHLDEDHSGPSSRDCRRPVLIRLLAMNPEWMDSVIRARTLLLDFLANPPLIFTASATSRRPDNRFKS